MLNIGRRVENVSLFLDPPNTYEQNANNFATRFPDGGERRSFVDALLAPPFGPNGQLLRIKLRGPRGLTK